MLALLPLPPAHCGDSPQFPPHSPQFPTQFFVPIVASGNRFKMPAEAALNARTWKSPGAGGGAPGRALATRTHAPALGMNPWSADEFAWGIQNFMPL
jgi:hypothetical protein